MQFIGWQHGVRLLVYVCVREREICFFSHLPVYEYVLAGCFVEGVFTISHVTKR